MASVVRVNQRPGQRGREYRPVRVRPRAAPRRPAPFSTADVLLESARQMFHARHALREAEEESKRAPELRRRQRRESAWTSFWHRSFELTGDQVGLCMRCKKAGLSQLEREVVVAFILERISLIDDSIDSCSQLFRFLGVAGADLISTLRALSEHARLYEAGFIHYDDPEEDLQDRTISIDPDLVDEVLYGRAGPASGFAVSTEEELYTKLYSITRAFAARSESFQETTRGGEWRPRRSQVDHNMREARRASRRVRQLWKRLTETLSQHKDWKLETLLNFDNGVDEEDRYILVILLGKELGHLPADDELFTFSGLTCAISEECFDIKESQAHLASNSTLISKGLIRPCGGIGTLLTDDTGEMDSVEFELTEKSLDVLSIKKRLVKKRPGDLVVRKAKVKMEQLVLSERVQDALKMALAQAKNADVLLTTWGLSEVIPYGRCVTLLFSGPPGTGKTACAEALAHHLDKPILVVDYGKMQSCWVGQTEKNINKVFRQARGQDAVLFWDEADAMFFDRDAASHAWEVRDVNVLLQELERFEGICILATNRKVTLDKALERRISLKLEFERPVADMRKKIWERLMPSKLPIAPDVCLDVLAKSDLSGGEIKNVVLNAARIALARGNDSMVTMADLQQAIDL